MTRKVMRLIDPSTGKMECTVCGAVHFARVMPDSGGAFYRGSWQCVKGCKPTGSQVVVSSEGSLARITPLTAKARTWLEENCQWQEYQIIGGSYVSDGRMAEPIIEALKEAGFKIGSP